MLSCYLRSMETLQSAPDPKDLTLSIDERCELIVWAADSMYRILPIFEKQYPADPRLRQGLAAVAEFNRGALSVGTMRQHALLCHATARDCETPSAQAVARACGHAIAIAHMGAHARNIERYTRKVLSGKPLTEELEWQRSHIPARFFSYVFAR